MLRPFLNIESLPSSIIECNGPGRSSGLSGRPPFLDVTPQSFSCHFDDLEEAERRCETDVFEWVGTLILDTLQDDLGSNLGVIGRGHRKSKFRNPASMVAFPGAAVERPLVVWFTTVFAMCDCDSGPRGAAWSNVKPGRGFVLKKQMLSDCTFRNSRSADDGTGMCKVGRIAAK